MLTAVVGTVVCQQAWILSAVGLLAMLAFLGSARGRWTRSGALGWANGLTALRVLGTACLLPFELSATCAIALAFAVFALDGVDGAIARKLGTSSQFGAEFDKECDAFFVASLCALLWTRNVAGIWVFVPGAWAYAYPLLLQLSKYGRTAPRSEWARYAYSTSSLCMMAALIPGNPVAVVMAAFSTVAVSASFGRSLYYSFVVTA